METHRIDIPEEFGGGWVDIKARRSWKDEMSTSVAGVHPRAGVTQAEMVAAEREGRLVELMEINAFERAIAPLIAAVVAVSPELKPEGMSVRSWLESDDMEADLGNFLIETVDAYYLSRTKTADERKTLAGISTLR